jgi:hypothetical protein
VLIGVVVLVVIAAVVAAGIAIVKGRDASAAAEDRLIEQITSRSLDLASSDRAVSALLAVAAWERWPDDVRTRSALLGVVATRIEDDPASLPIGGPDAYALTGVDPSGAYLVTGSRAARDADADDRRPLTVWDVRTGTAVVDLTTFTDPDPARTQAFVAAAEWIGPGRLFLVFDDPQTRGEHYALYDVAHGIATKAVLADPVQWFFAATGGRLYGLIPIDPAAGRFRLVRYDQQTLRRVSEPIELDIAPRSVSASSDGARIVVTGWSDTAPHWRTRVYDAGGRLLAEGLDGTTRTVVADARVIAADRSGLLSLTLGLATKGSLAADPASSVRLSVDDAGRTLVTTAGETVRVLALPSGRELGRPIHVPGLAAPSVVDADGGGFTLSGDLGVRHVPLEPAAQAASACRIAGREPTAAEWADLFAGLGPRHPLCHDALASLAPSPTG